MDKKQAEAYSKIYESLRSTNRNSYGEREIDEEATRNFPGNRNKRLNEMVIIYKDQTSSGLSI